MARLNTGQSDEEEAEELQPDQTWPTTPNLQNPQNQVSRCYLKVLFSELILRETSQAQTPDFAPDQADDDAPSEASRVSGDDEAKSKPKKPRKVATTKQQYLDKGAISQPPDGLNSKPPGKKCLRCIHQGMSCYGSEIEDGQCLSCRGIGKGISQNTGQRVKLQKRDCRWVEADKGIFTIEDVLNYYPRNSRTGRKASQPKNKPPSTPETPTPVVAPLSTSATPSRNLVAVSDTPQPIAQPNVFDFDAESPEHLELLRLIVVFLTQDGVHETPRLRLVHFMQMAWDEFQAAPNDTTAGRLRRRYINAVYHRVDARLRSGGGFTHGELYFALSEDHPLRQQGRRGG